MLPDTNVCRLCEPLAVTFSFEGPHRMLVHFQTDKVPNKGNPFWLDLGRVGCVRLKLCVIIGLRATYAVDAWHSADQSAPPEEPLWLAFLDLPQGGPSLA